LSQALFPAKQPQPQQQQQKTSLLQILAGWAAMREVDEYTYCIQQQNIKINLNQGIF
jgi:hypothetical protein